MSLFRRSEPKRDIKSDNMMILDELIESYGRVERKPVVRNPKAASRCAAYLMSKDMVIPTNNPGSCIECEWMSNCQMLRDFVSASLTATTQG